MLTPEQQATFVEELPEVFIPVAGGWGRMGATHIGLNAASEDVLTGALRTAWKLRLEENAKSGKKSRTETKGRRKPQTAWASKLPGTESLFVAQGYHRISTHRPPSGDVAGEKCDCPENDEGTEHGCCVMRVQSEEQFLKHANAGQRQGNPC
jgi:hypothetical protein